MSRNPGDDGREENAYEHAAPEGSGHQHCNDHQARQAQPDSCTLHLVAHACIAGGCLRRQATSLPD